MTLGGRVVGSRHSTEEFNVGNPNPVGSKRRSSLNFKSNGFVHVFGKKRELGYSDWVGKSLTIVVNGEGKGRVARNKGGLRSSLWVSRDQRKHMPSGSRVHKAPVEGSDQIGAQVGLPEPTSPSRLEMGESPTSRDLIPLSQHAYALVMSKAPHEASVAQDITRAKLVLAEESPVLPEKADIARQQAPMTAACSATQTEMFCSPAKVSVFEGGSFPDQFHVGASPAKLDRAVIAPFHTTRPGLVSVPPSEHMGCPAKTSAKVESLFFWWSLRQ